MHLDGCVRTENARVNKVRKPCSFRMFSLLPCKNQYLQRISSLAKYLAWLSQGSLLLHRGPNAGELTNLIKCTSTRELLDVMFLPCWSIARERSHHSPARVPIRFINLPGSRLFGHSAWFAVDLQAREQTALPSLGSPHG